MKQIVFGLLLSSVCAFPAFARERVFLPQIAGFQSQPSPSAKELVRKGTRLMSSNRVDAAIESYTRAIELNPNYAEAYVNRGIAKRAKGDLEGCIDDYDKAFAINPKSIADNRFIAQAYSNRGFIRANELDVDGAIDDFTKAINITPSENEHYYKRGHALLIRGDLEDALKDLNKALSLVNAHDPSARIFIYATRGMLKFQQGKDAEGQVDIDEARRLNTDQRFQLEGYLWELEAKIEHMKQLRLKKQRSIASWNK